MPNTKQFSAEDVIKIMKQAGKSGVSSLSIGDLQINYSTPEEISQDIKSVPQQIPDKLEEEVEMEAANNLDEYQESLLNEALDCDDPAAYEKMIFNGLKIQKQEETE